MILSTLLDFERHVVTVVLLNIFFHPATQWIGNHTKIVLKRGRFNLLSRVFPSMEKFRKTVKFAININITNLIFVINQNS